MDSVAAVSSPTGFPPSGPAPTTPAAGIRRPRAATEPASAEEAAARRRKSRLFGMIIPDPANPFFTELLTCFEAIVSNENHDLMVASTHFDPKRVQASVQRMLLRNVDGIVLAASELLTSHEAIRHFNVPVVTIDRGQVAERVSDVSIDFENAMFDAVRHLEQMGHRRIAFIGGFPGPKVSQTRLQAFRIALEVCGLELHDGFLREGDYRAEGGAAAMAELLALRTRPTAVVAVNDLTAIGALQLLQDRGIAVPEKMSIIGFDDIAMASLIHPRLTTLRISRSMMARMLYDALLHVRDERVKRGSLYKMRADLVVRDSVANLKTVRRTRVSL